jgi:uncharacterized protein
MTRILLDSGPLVAFYSTKDQHHAWTFKQFHSLAFPVFTCEPVLIEACFLMQRNRGNPRTILQAVQRGIIKVDFTLANESTSLEALLERYADTPMSLADACLVRMSELFHSSCVFTLDTDFKKYRRNRRQVIPLLTP